MLNIWGDWIFTSSQNSYIKVLAHNMIVLENGAFERLLGLDEVMKSLHDEISTLLTRETPELPLCPVRVQWEEGHLPARQRVSPRTRCTLILNYSASKTMRNKFLFFKQLSLWYIVVTARSDQDNLLGLFYLQIKETQLKQASV